MNNVDSRVVGLQDALHDSRVFITPRAQDNGGAKVHMLCLSNLYWPIQISFPSAAPVFLSSCRFFKDFVVFMFMLREYKSCSVVVWYRFLVRGKPGRTPRNVAFRHMPGIRGTVTSCRSPAATMLRCTNPTATMVPIREAIGFSRNPHTCVSWWVQGWPSRFWFQLCSWTC